MNITSSSIFSDVLNKFTNFGEFLIFQLKLTKQYVSVFKQPKLLIQQINIIGVGSVAVITLTALFTGMVESIQLYSGFSQFGVENFIGYTIFISITKELGPVFGALMLISRSISAMAAELGTMKVSEQVDAIDILGMDSKEFLLVPRIIASIISLPLLVIWFDFVAIQSSFIVSTTLLDIDSISYQSTISELGKIQDVLSGVIKAIFFGWIVAMIGTYSGYHATGGARGVGEATIQAVVYSAVAIFVANYFISSTLMLFGF